MALQTLEQYNEGIQTVLNAASREGTNIACPECGQELFSNPSVSPASQTELTYDKPVFCLAGHTLTIKVLTNP